MDRMMEMDVLFVHEYRGRKGWILVSRVIGWGCDFPMMLAKLSVAVVPGKTVAYALLTRAKRLLRADRYENIVLRDSETKVVKWGTFRRRHGERRKDLGVARLFVIDHVERWSLWTWESKIFGRGESPDQLAELHDLASGYWDEDAYMILVSGSAVTVAVKDPDKAFYAKMLPQD